MATKDVVVERFAYLPSGTLGRIRTPGFTCYTLEPPWLGNEKNKSCIPIGRYTLHALDDKKRGAVWWVKPVRDREGILIHVLNWVTQTEGCIGVGLGFNITDRVPELINSTAALELLNTFLDRKALHNMEIVNTKAGIL